MSAQLDMFVAQETSDEFIARWHLLDSPSPHKAGGRLCYGLVSFRLRDLKRHGRHRDAAELAIAINVRWNGWADEWLSMYPMPTVAHREQGTMQ